MYLYHINVSLSKNVSSGEDENETNQNKQGLRVERGQPPMLTDTQQASREPALMRPEPRSPPLLTGPGLPLVSSAGPGAAPTFSGTRALRLLHVGDRRGPGDGES